MPEVDMFYVINWLIKLGMYRSGFNGLIPLTYQDIDSWANRTLTNVSPWESEVLITLSMSYCNQYAKGSKADCEEPYDTGIEKKIQQEIADRKIRAAFG